MQAPFVLFLRVIYIRKGDRNVLMRGAFRGIFLSLKPNSRVLFLRGFGAISWV